jgi:Protein of unknown function (DUF2934)
MSTTSASIKDQEGPQEPSFSSRPSKAASVKKPRVKKASATKIQKPLPAVMEQESKTPSTNGDVQARITERAYELYHRRGGHHGQDLDDWFAAEQEILAQDS